MKSSVNFSIEFPMQAWTLCLITFLLLILAGCASTVKNRNLEFVSGDGPVYPPAARAEGIEGYVVLEYTVSATGKVYDVRVVEAKPPNVFDRAALEAIDGWTYRPRIKNGVFVQSPRVRSTLTFQLDTLTNYPQR